MSIKVILSASPPSFLTAPLTGFFLGSSFYTHPSERTSLRSTLSEEEEEEEASLIVVVVVVPPAENEAFDFNYIRRGVEAE